MSQQQRTRLSRFISEERGWDLGGVESAVLRLAQTGLTPLQVAQKAVAAALDSTARTPAAMHAERSAPGPVVMPPKVERVWCETHGARTALRIDGTPACCWNDRADNTAPVPSSRVSHGCPPQVRQQILSTFSRVGGSRGDTKGDRR